MKRIKQVTETAPLKVTSFQPLPTGEEAIAAFKSSIKSRDDGSNKVNVEAFLSAAHRIVSAGGTFGVFDIIKELKHAEDSLPIETIFELWHNWKDIQVRFNRIVPVQSVYDYEVFLVQAI